MYLRLLYLLYDAENEIKISKFILCFVGITRLTRRSLASKEYSSNQNFAIQRDTNNLLHNNASYIGNHSYSTNSRSSKFTGLFCCVSFVNMLSLIL